MLYSEGSTSLRLYLPLSPSGLSAMHAAVCTQHIHSSLSVTTQRGSRRQVKRSLHEYIRGITLCPPYSFNARASQVAQDFFVLFWVVGVWICKGSVFS